MILAEKRIRGLVEDLTSVVSKLSDDVTPKSVHRLRTTIRRIESLVGYAQPDLGKKLERTMERLADLRKRAGKVRDVDVQIPLLDQLGNGSTARDRKSLLDLLQKKRERQATRLAGVIGKLAADKLFVRVERIAEKTGENQRSPGRLLEPMEQAQLQLAQMAQDLSSRQSLKPNRLHQARIQVKKIRYLAELAEESPEQQSLIRELRSAQDAVGEWHDWEELAKLAEKRFAGRASCALLSEVRALFAARHSAAVSALTRLLASSTGAAGRKPPRPAQSARTVARQA